MDIDRLLFQASDWVPNNPSLPVLLYRSVFITENGSEEFARLFTSHGWTGVWRNGVFDYQHYHSGAHEVLGIGKGQATLLIGGPDGKEIEVRAGDCILLPAGTGHMRLDASADFEVVGAYPDGQEADIQTTAPSKATSARLARLQVPESDPIQGCAGAVMTVWHRHG
jgi:uncharacterized protein YjlB